MSLVDKPGQPPHADEGSPGFLSSQPARRRPESALVRGVATAGIVGIGTAVGAAMGAADAATWLIAFVVSVLSVMLAAILWRSRVL